MNPEYIPKYVTYCPNCGTELYMEMGEITHCETCESLIGRLKEDGGYEVKVIHSDRQLIEVPG